MCMVVYIASDHILPEIGWDAENPGFNVTSQLQESEARVRGSFTKKHVYYAGSHEGCGCGFRYTTLDECRSVYGDDPEALADNERARESVRRLRAYLEAAVASGPVELYAVWAGDEAKEPITRLSVTPSHFGGESFEFEEKQFFEVSACSPG